MESHASGKGVSPRGLEHIPRALGIVDQSVRKLNPKMAMRIPRLDLPTEPMDTPWFEYVWNNFSVGNIELRKRDDDWVTDYLPPSPFADSYSMDSWNLAGMIRVGFWNSHGYEWGNITDSYHGWAFRGTIICPVPSRPDPTIEKVYLQLGRYWTKVASPDPEEAISDNPPWSAIDQIWVLSQPVVNWLWVEELQGTPVCQSCPKHTGETQPGVTYNDPWLSIDITDYFKKWVRTPVVSSTGQISIKSAPNFGLHFVGMNEAFDQDADKDYGFFSDYAFCLRVFHTREDANPPWNPPSWGWKSPPYPGA